jgi:hypothetical protein
MFVGMTNQVEITGIAAGAPYELRVLKDGHRPGYITITSDEWRAEGTDPNTPINVVKKKPMLEKSVNLEPDPSAAKPTEKPKKAS